MVNGPMTRNAADGRRYHAALTANFTMGNVAQPESSLPMHQDVRAGARHRMARGIQCGDVAAGAKSYHQGTERGAESFFNCCIGGRGLTVSVATVFRWPRRNCPRRGSLDGPAEGGRGRELDFEAPAALEAS